MIAGAEPSEKEMALTPEIEIHIKKQVKRLVKKELKKEQQAQQDQPSEASLDSFYNKGARFFGSALFNFYHTAAKDIEHADPKNWPYTGTGVIIQAWLRLPCIVAAVLLGTSAFLFFPELAGILSGTIATLTGAPPFVSTSIATCMTALGVPTVTNMIVSAITDIIIHRRFGGPGELMNTERDRTYFAEQANLSPELLKLIEEAANSIQEYAHNENVETRLYEGMTAIRKGDGISGLEIFTDVCRDRIKALKKDQTSLQEIYEERQKALAGQETLLSAFEKEKNAKLTTLTERVAWLEKTVTQINAKLK